MAFTLRIVFRGVIMFHPNRPFFYRAGDRSWQAQQPDRVWVLIPRIDSPRLAPWDCTDSGTPQERLNYVDTHHALLLAERGKLARKNRALKAPFQHQSTQLKPKRDYLIKSVSEDLLAVDGAAPDCIRCDLTLPHYESQPIPRRAGEVLPSQTNQQVLCTENQHRSLWWLPRLSEVTGSNWTLPERNNPDCPSFRFPESDLAGALCLKTGFLSASSFNRWSGTPYPWHFSTAKRDAYHDLQEEPANQRQWKRAIANELTWTARIPGRSATIRFGPKARHEFEIRPCILDREATLLISNVETDRYLRHRQGSMWYPNTDESGFFDPDFDVLYKLMKPVGETLSLRYPFRGGGQSGLSSRPCSGGT